MGKTKKMKFLFAKIVKIVLRAKTWEIYLFSIRKTNKGEKEQSINKGQKAR